MQNKGIQLDKIDAIDQMDNAVSDAKGIIRVLRDCLGGPAEKGKSVGLEAYALYSTLGVILDQVILIEQAAKVLGQSGR